MAMNGPFADDFWKACEAELETLTDDMDAWDVVNRTPDMKVLPSTWAFKVVILAAKERLAAVQYNTTTASVTAPIPRSGVCGAATTIRSRNKQCLYYDMKQSPRYFLAYLTEKLQKQGLEPLNIDPCLFLGKDLLAIIYVDDVLFYGRSEDAIDELIEKLKHDDVRLRKEGTAEGYLGLKVERDGNKTILSQPGLIKRVVEGLGLSTKFTSSLPTPAEQAPLPRDLDGEPATGCFNYASIVGMLHYLNHTRPYGAFAIHQCAQYTFGPKRSHEAAVKRIGHYLKGTMTKGLVLDPIDDLTIDCYPDAEFAGLWGHEHPQDPHCAHSQTGYVITLAG
ncbi:hypothetical protein ACHAWF_002908 [Thalassiosira exigua]